MRGFFFGFVFTVFQIFYEMLMLFWKRNEMLVGWLVTKSCATFVTPWTVANEDPLSLGLPRPSTLGGLPLPSPEALPDPGIKPVSPLQAVSLLLSYQESLIK